MEISGTMMMMRKKDFWFLHLSRNCPKKSPRATENSPDAKKWHKSEKKIWNASWNNWKVMTSTDEIIRQIRGKSFIVLEGEDDE